jgi:hypothetical protein
MLNAPTFIACLEAMTANHPDHKDALRVAKLWVKQAKVRFGQVKAMASSVESIDAWLDSNVAYAAPSLCKLLKFDAHRREVHEWVSAHIHDRTTWPEGELHAWWVEEWLAVYAPKCAWPWLGVHRRSNPRLDEPTRRKALMAWSKWAIATVERMEREMDTAMEQWSLRYE